MSEKCPLCRRRRAGRACPALGHRICAVCCGTKRLAEIDCPRDCRYLVSSQAHPPAVVQRRQERDMLFVLPLLHDLTGRQQELVLLIQGLLLRDREATPGLRDIDVEHAVRALAETYETASRGIIYEHAAGVASAERLSAAIRTLIETLREKGLRIGDADVAGALRRVEQGARDAGAALPGGDAAYLDLLKRLHPADGQLGDPAADDPTGTGGSGLIVPG